MKYPILPFVVLSVLLFSACSAPVSKDSIRLEPAYSTSFMVNKPYQHVFAVLLKRSQACYLERPTSRQQTLVGNRDNGKKTANITLEYVYAMAGRDVILMVDIKAEQADKTRVNVYASRKDDVKKADIFEKWLDDPQKQQGCA